MIWLDSFVYSHYRWLMSSLFYCPSYFVFVSKHNRKWTYPRNADIIIVRYIMELSPFFRDKMKFNNGNSLPNKFMRVRVEWGNIVFHIIFNTMERESTDTSDSVLISIDLTSHNISSQFIINDDEVRDASPVSISSRESTSESGRVHLSALNNLKRSVQFPEDTRDVDSSWKYGEIIQSFQVNSNWRLS